jgi:CheY-like chemotaxis protein
MNILLIEDRGSTAFFVKKWLSMNGHNILEASDINDAQCHWNNRIEIPIDCIILDLQMTMDGLNDEQKLEAAGGALTGWVWLRDTVLMSTPKMRQRVIIYSDYLELLINEVGSDQTRGIKMISKRQQGSSNVVMASIREIGKLH